MYRKETNISQTGLIKILFLAANPSNTTRVRLDRESRAIDQALRQAEFRDRFEIKQHWAVSVSDLQGLLLRHGPDIVHFSGHGSRAGEIILEKASRSGGNARDATRELELSGARRSSQSGHVSARALSQTFALLRDNIRCVVLNACYSEDQAQAIAEHIDCVIGMTTAVGDEAAISFAAAFYQGLGYGRDVKTAFGLGCAQIDLENLDEQDTPKLLALRSNPTEIVFLDGGEVTATPPKIPAKALEEASSRSEPEIPPPPLPIPLPEVPAFCVEREAELKYFSKKLEESHLAVITGMPGVGKTVLAIMLARKIGELDKTFWHSFHEGEGIEVIIFKLAGFLYHRGHKDLWDTLHQLRSRSATPSEMLLDYLFPIIRKQRYLLCFDDFHFVDEDRLLARLADRIRHAVLAGDLTLILISRRMPKFVPRFEFEPLSGLTAADTHRLLANRNLSLPDDLADRLHMSTGGNAQFLTLAIGALQHSKNEERLIAQLLEAEDVERYLLREVDRDLREDERKAMQALSILIGYPGTRDAVEAILDRGNMQRTLSDLLNRHLLTVQEGEGGREYKQHPLIQAFYYNTIGQRERQVMHTRAGELYLQGES